MTDDQIILRIIAGDTEAFSLLLDRHHDRCVRFAFRMLGNQEDAEEAAQDAFLRAFRALAGYEPREQFHSWLMRILVNQCRTMLARRKRLETVFPPLELIEHRTAFAATLADDSDWSDLDHALAQLPADQREAIVLRFAEDLSFDEMSRVTGAGVSALKMRVQRAYTRLRSLLTEVSLV